MRNPENIEETENEIFMQKGKDVEVKFKKGLSSDEFTKWLEDKNLIEKKEEWFSCKIKSGEINRKKWNFT